MWAFCRFLFFTFSVARLSEVALKLCTSQLYMTRCRGSVMLMLDTENGGLKMDSAT